MLTKKTRGEVPRHRCGRIANPGQVLELVDAAYELKQHLME